MIELDLSHHVFKPRRKHQQGAYAVELALVFPLFILFIFSIFVFSFAFMSRHLLENLAADTARQCVSRSHNGENSVTDCVVPLGRWLASRLPPVMCWGQPVSFTPEIRSSGVAGTSSSNKDYINLSFLVVTASCQWTFVPGKSVLGASKTVSMPGAEPLKATAAAPFATYLGPP